MKLIYARGHGIGSWLIRLGSWWEPWSHVGIVTDENTVIEARMWQGVVETPMADFLDRCTAWEVVDRPAPYGGSGIEWARKQVGSRYDVGAILAFITRKKWSAKRAWMCVELAETALIVAGLHRFRKAAERLNLAHSYMVI